MNRKIRNTISLILLVSVAFVIGCTSINNTEKELEVKEEKIDEKTDEVIIEPDAKEVQDGKKEDIHNDNSGINSSEAINIKVDTRSKEMKYEEKIVTSKVTTEDRPTKEKVKVINNTSKEDESSVSGERKSTVESSDVKPVSNKEQASNIPNTTEVVDQDPKEGIEEEEKEDNSVYIDGVYTGTGKGGNGPISVEVTIASDEITTVKITDHSEYKEIMDKAIEWLPGMIVAAGGTEDVDTVSGATGSSKGILEGVDDALSKAIRNKEE